MRQDITIEGMGCDHCVHTIREALENLDGVTVEEVEIGRARVSFDPDAVGEEQIDVAIHAAGYESLIHRNA
jgi:copper chaperone CopZ